MTKFSAHKKYLTRVLLSPDVKCVALGFQFDNTSESVTTGILPRALQIPPWRYGLYLKIMNSNKRRFFKVTNAGCGIVRSVPTLLILLQVSISTINFIYRMSCILLLTSASSDHTARLWEMASGETVRQYNGHHKGEPWDLILRRNLKYASSGCLLRTPWWSWLGNMVSMWNSNIYIDVPPDCVPELW